MSQSGGLISRVFRRLIAFSQKNIKFVGEDHYGNKYYEKTADSSRRAARWVESPGQDKDATYIPELPTEWESWLRRRRKDPPTQEEIDQNYAMMLRTQHRAKELEAANKTDSLAKASDKSYTETVTEESFKSKFPQYEDFEIAPGQFKEKQQPKDG